MVDPDLHARYQRALSTNADLVKRAVEDLLAHLEGLTPEQQAQLLLAEYPKLVRDYGKVAADVARQYYQESRDAYFEDDDDTQEYTAQAAAPVAETWAWEDVQSAAGAGLGNLPKKAVRRVMQRADQTIARNVGSDPARPRWAIVPHFGACGWCVMIASNGWSYSERSVNAQRHDGCKCSVAVDFDRDSPSLAGYDVDALRRQYEQGIEDAGGDESILARWNALTPEERKRYQRNGRVSYSVFKTKQITQAMDARSKRVSEYEKRRDDLAAQIKKATRGDAKRDPAVWANRIDSLIADITPKAGSVHAQTRADFSAEELMVALRLASEGHDIEIIKANSKPGTHTPDFLVDGVPMEVKQLTVWSKDRLGKNIHKASAQSRNVIMDLSLETISREDAIAKARELLNTPMTRYLSKYEKSHNASRGKREIRVDSVTLVFHDRIEVIKR